MSKYYNAQRTKNIFDPNSSDPFKLSRTKIDLFLECPRCFYLDRRLGVGRPPGYPFTLNTAVDALLKKEFDIHRAKGEAHPLMKTYGIAAIPTPHENLAVWRNNFEGIQFLHPETNLIIFGAIDDLWLNSKEEYVVVDYKATSTKEKIESLDKEWHEGYKRQMEIYQWLLRKNGYRVSNTGYFVYCNGVTDREAFDGKLEFDVVIIPYEGSDSWVEGTIFNIHECLMNDTPPEPSLGCDYCSYREAASSAL
ncbi:MAG: PD-(D/E)XK nuclease family protein [Thermodesulfobacteriota bacterium]